VLMIAVIRLQRTQAAAVRVEEPPQADAALGGSLWAAFGQVVRSPYLLGIALFVLLMTWVSTFLYLEQQAFVAKAFATADERTRFFGGIDFWVQAASLLMQLLFFGRLFKWVGLRAMLVSVPVIMTAGYALVALAPGFMVLVVVYAMRRVGDYALTRPCRDALFTVVSREEKYKAKSLIDTFVYRGGDALRSRRCGACWRSPSARLRSSAARWSRAEAGGRHGFEGYAALVSRSSTAPSRSAVAAAMISAAVPMRSSRDFASSRVTSV